MAVHASHGALPFPVKGARFSMLVPLLDADGDPTAQTTPDTEISEDNAAATDAAEEVSATSGMDGMGLITFTGAETDCSTLAVAFKAASGPKTTLATLYPRVLPIIETGTAQAGGASTITLASAESSIEHYYTGCIVKTTGGTGGGGTGGASNQARVITGYVGSTKVATVTPAWETNPSSDTTYDILLTDNAYCRLADLRAIAAAEVNTSAAQLGVNVVQAATVAWASGAISASVLASNTITDTKIATGAITAAKFAAGAIDAAAIADGAIDAGAIAADAITAAKIADGAIDAATFAAGAITATVIATGAIDADALAADTITAAKVAADVSTELNAAVLAILGTPAGASMSADIAAIEAQTDDIGAAGAGLTAVPWNAAWDAEVQSEVDDALVAQNLDHLVKIAVDTDFPTTVHLNSVVGHLADAGGTATFDRTTDALEVLGAATAPSAAVIADAVWDETLAGHLGAGSTGEALNAAGAAGDPWVTALPGAYSSGQAGKIVGDNLNATVSSRATQTSVDDLPTNAELATALGTADDAVLAILGTPSNLGSGATVAANLVDIEGQTDDIGTAGAGLTALATAAELAKVPKSDGTVSWNATAAAQLQAEATDALNAYDPPTRTEATTDKAEILTRLGTPAGASVSADIAAIEAQTDDIGAAGAGLTAVAWNPAWDAEVQSEVQDALDAILADSVPADGTRPSLAQAAYMIVQFLTERSVGSTTVTVKKVDGSTNLMTFTLDDATTPTSITRTT